MDLPKDIDPYKVLDLQSTASEDDIKRAYRRAALKTHPDKARDEDKDAFHEKFQQVAFAYSILSDPKRRACYDRTGSTEEGEDLEELQGIFTDLFNAGVTKEMIEQDKREYRQSGEEQQDILKYYTEGKGDLDVVFEHVLHSNFLEDEHRFRGIIQDAIDSGKVPAYAKFTAETKKKKDKRRKAAQKEAKEAEVMAKDLGLGKESSEDSLALLIKSRGQKRMDSLIDSLEEKYGKKDSKRSKKAKKEEDGPSEEEFARIQRELKNKKKKTKSK